MLLAEAVCAGTWKTQCTATARRRAGSSRPVTSHVPDRVAQHLDNFQVSTEQSHHTSTSTSCFSKGSALSLAVRLYVLEPGRHSAQLSCSRRARRRAPSPCSCRHTSRDEAGVAELSRPVYASSACISQTVGVTNTVTGKTFILNSAGRPASVSCYLDPASAGHKGQKDKMSNLSIKYYHDS